MLKIHEMIEREKPEFVQDIKANALRVGLDKIDFNEVYTLKKLGAKTSSPRGYPDAYTVIRNGKVCLIGNNDFVAIYVSGLSDWFKTSPVIGVKKTKDGIRIETENSYYLLESQ